MNNIQGSVVTAVNSFQSFNHHMAKGNKQYPIVPPILWIIAIRARLSVLEISNPVTKGDCRMEFVEKLPKLMARKNNIVENDVKIKSIRPTTTVITDMKNTGFLPILQ